MKRLVWGIIATVVGVLSLAGAGHNPQGPAGSIVIGLLCLGGGGALAYFGQRYRSRRRSVADLAFAMLREKERIHADEVARRLGMSESDVRSCLMDAQRAGLIPVNAVIV